MFGPGEEVLPENAREEAEMLEAKRNCGSEVEGGEETIVDPQPPPPSSPYHQAYTEEKARVEREEMGG